MRSEELAQAAISEERLRRGLRRLDAALSNALLNDYDKPGSRQSPAACWYKKNLFRRNTPSTRWIAAVSAAEEKSHAEPRSSGGCSRIWKAVTERVKRA